MKIIIVGLTIWNFIEAFMVSFHKHMSANFENDIGIPASHYVRMNPETKKTKSTLNNIELINESNKSCP